MNNNKVTSAAYLYLAREKRYLKPSGKYDKARRWYPDDEIEKCECCCFIRSPSKAWPSSLYRHCCSLGHICNMLGVDRKTVANFLRKNRSELEETVKDYIKKRPEIW